MALDGFRVIPVSGRGQCLYNAVSLATGGPEVVATAATATCPGARARGFCTGSCLHPLRQRVYDWVKGHWFQNPDMRPFRASSRWGTQCWTRGAACLHWVVGWVPGCDYALGGPAGCQCTTGCEGQASSSKAEAAASVVDVMCCEVRRHCTCAQRFGVSLLLPASAA